MNYPLLLLVACTGWLFMKLLRQYQLRSLAKKHGCQPLTPVPQPIYDRLTGFGYGLYKIDEKAAQSGKILESTLARFRQLGHTFSGNLMGHPFIATTEPDNAKAMLWDQESHYKRGNHEQFKILLGHAIFTTDGDRWKHSRLSLKPLFVKDRLTRLDTLETHLQALLSRLPAEGETVDLQPLFHQLTFDTILDFAFSERPATGPGKDDYMAELAELFDYSQSELSRRDRMGWALLFYRNPEFDRVRAKIYNALNPIIDQERAKWQKAKDSKDIILGSVFSMTESTDQVRNELLTLAVAGRDTLAGLFSNLFFVLSRRPEIYKKLRAEIEAFGDAIPSYNDLKDFTYVSHVIHEAMRIFPPSPTLARDAARDTVLPRGGGPNGQSPIVVPKGTRVSLSLFGMHMRKDIYGEDADEFRPERWEDIRPGWAFLPFSGGPRVCIGQQYALVRAKYILARLVREFEVVESRSDGPWMESWRLALSCGSDTKVALYSRRPTGA